MDNHYEIRLSGSGGQGLILSSIILAEAATFEGKYVTQSQSYGPEARGGASRAEVIISDMPIDYPLVREADILLALTEAALEKYRYSIKDSGLILYDNSINGKVFRAHYYSYPIIETAYKQIKNPITANMISLGVLSMHDIPVKPETIKKYILDRVPKKTKEININAFSYGQSLVK